jgi:hypothetical protein
MAARANGSIPCSEWAGFVMPLIAMRFVISVGAQIAGLDQLVTVLKLNGWSRFLEGSNKEQYSNV